MEATDSRTFAELLRRHRTAAGLTQEELAERAGLSPRGMVYLERAGRLPFRDTVRRLADALVLAEEDRAVFVSAARRPRHAAGAQAIPFSPDDDQEPADQSWVYLAHAAADAAPAERLRADLRRQGIAVWVDEHDLLPGTPSWEQALRDAIRAASALVLVASSHTRASRYIGDELRIAELYGRRVYPIWVEGEQWLDCIPLGWGGLLYLDARGGRYAGALAALVTELRHPPGRPVPHALPIAASLATVRNPYKGLRPFSAEDAGDYFGRDALIDALLTALPADPAGAPRFLALVGASGSGKSSLVRAGLLPRLQAGALSGSAQWIYLAPVVPGAHPLDALARSLAPALPNGEPGAVRAALDESPRALDEIARRLVTGPEQRVVLVVDQGEEVFATACPEEERRQWIDLLVTAVTLTGGPTLVILTLRADFYDRPLRYQAFGALVHAQSVVLLPPTLADLRRTIEGPAGLPDVQLSFDDDLVGDLLFDLRGQSGALPLLQFTLDQLFARRDGRRLTGAAYRALGGVRGALARHAEATYAALPGEEHRRLAQALFLRLIDPGATEQDAIRRRATLAALELPDPGQTVRLRAVLDAFIAARLLVISRVGMTPADAPETSIEVSHEALIREWARLGEWVRAAREDIRRQQTIGADAAAWLQRGRPADHLYRGSLLLEAEAWALRTLPNTQEAAFLEAARAAQRGQERDERERQSRQLALARLAATRLRALVGVLVVFLLAAAGLTALALTNAQQAQRAQQRALASAQQAQAARQQADAARQAALSRQLAAQAVTRFDSQYDLALLLSLEAWRVAPTVEARAGLLQGLEAAPPGLIGFLRGHLLGVNSVAISRDGTILASGSEDGTIRLWNVRQRRSLGLPLNPHAGPIWGVAFSPNGTLLASGDNNGTVRLWDVTHRRPLGPPVPAHGGTPATPLAFSPDGTTLASAGDDGRIMVWDVTSNGSLTNALAVDGCPNANGAQSWALAISPNGKVLANGCTDGSIQQWDMHGTALAYRGTLSGHTGPVFGVTFSPDGKTLASAGGDQTVRLWDVARQLEIGSPLIGHTATVLSVAFSPDGSTLASGGLDALRLWDVRSQGPLGPPLEGHTGDANSVVFSPDGAMLATGTADGSVALWDVRRSRQLSAARTSSLGQAGNVFVGPDGKTLVALSTDGTALQVWTLTGGAFAPRTTSAVGAQVSGVAFSSDGRMLAVASYSGGGSAPASAIQLADGGTGYRFAQPVTAPEGANSLAFSPNGQVIASAGNDGTIQLWSVARRPRGMLRPLGRPLPGTPVWTLAFSPGGTLLASGDADGSIRLWDVVRRRLLGPALTGNLAGVYALAFSPNGAILASAGSDRTVRLWDVARRRPLGPPLIGHTDTVLSVAFSHDGTILASGSTAPGIRLWDVASGQPLGAPLSTGQSGSGSMAFTTDGTTLVAGRSDGNVVRWDLDLPAWPRRACRIANRNLTRQEWRQYLGGLPYQQTCPDLPPGS